jgi:hypothetical protein
MRSSLPYHRINQGFTLVELLIGGVVSAVVLGSVAVLAVHQIRIADNVYTSTLINRNFKRLSDLLKVEVGEACLLRGDVNPRTTATLPDTPCKPLATSNCSGAATSDLRLLIPVAAADNTIGYNVVRYYLNGTDLLRDGPQVGTDGLLTTTAATGSRVLSNVTTFTPTVSADCTWVSLVVGLTVPGTNAVNRTLTLYSGASESIN